MLRNMLRFREMPKKPKMSSNLTAPTIFNPARFFYLPRKVRFYYRLMEAGLKAPPIIGGT